MESVYTVMNRPVSDALKLGKKMLDLLNCPNDNTGIDCMRSKSISDILS